MPTFAQHGNANTKLANLISEMRLVEAILSEAASGIVVRRAMRAGILPASQRKSY